jgi:hypothetical protein
MEVTSVRLFFASWLVCVVLVSSSTASDISEQDLEQNRIEMAREAILISMLNAASPIGRYACSKQNHVCAGPDRAELGLAILESGKSTKHSNALVELIALKIDGALAEGHACALIHRRRAIMKLISTANPEELKIDCFSNVEKIKSRTSPLYADVTPDKVCWDAVAIKARISEIQAMVKKNAICDP